MPDPAMDLRSAILGELSTGSAEASQLARRLGVSRERVLRELEVMALRDLVDAHEPPPPCGWDQMRWFACRPKAVAA